jgi:hypothetical protein
MKAHRAAILPVMSVHAGPNMCRATADNYKGYTENTVSKRSFSNS